MDQLVSKNIIVYLSGYEPTTSSYSVLNSMCLQGNTNIVFNLTGIQSSVFGYYKVEGNINDTTIFALYPILSGNIPVLTIDTFTYTLYPSSGVTPIDISVYYRNGLSATFMMYFSCTPANILDMDLTVINTQMLYSNDVFIPFLNLEDNKNTVYTSAFVALTAAASQNQVVYLKTNQEIDTSLSATSFSSLSDSAYINTQYSERIRAL